MSMSVEPGSDAAVVSPASAAPVSYPSVSSTTVFPIAPVVAKKTYASAMSYVGTTRRTTAWVRKVGSGSAAAAIMAWSVAACFLTLMYLFLVVWYVVVFGLFGVFTFPYRLIRRSQRKSQHVQETQLATMQAMLVQQQQALLANQNRPSTWT